MSKHLVSVVDAYDKIRHVGLATMGSGSASAVTGLGQWIAENGTVISIAIAAIGLLVNLVFSFLSFRLRLEEKRREEKRSQKSDENE